MHSGPFAQARQFYRRQEIHTAFFPACLLRVTCHRICSNGYCLLLPLSNAMAIHQLVLPSNARQCRQTTTVLVWHVPKVERATAVDEERPR